MSKFTTIPYRVRIRQLDITGSRPSILRTGDPRRMGNYPVMFDDGKSEIFVTQSVVYPDMLASGDPTVSNEANENPIRITQSLKKGLSPISRDIFTENFPGFYPFDETRIYLNRSGTFYVSGTSEDVYPGFRTSIKSKIQIPIDLSSREESVITRFPATRALTGSELAGSTNPVPHNRGKTGFVYFNFEKRRWEDIGLTDPATKANIKYDYSVESSAGKVTSGTSLFPMQFANSPCRSKFAASHTQLIDAGYDRIGSPTNICGAPFLNKYHATSSQCFSLTSSIAHPIAVEKILVELPIVVRKRQGALLTGSDGHTPSLVEGAARDIDNYVFFIYRQSRNSTRFERDSPQDVTGSKRYLVGSASMSFINSNVVGSNLSLVSHNPSFHYDFNNAVSGTDAKFLESVFTGSVFLEIIPASPSLGFSGESSLPSRGSTAHQNGITTCLFQNAWSGGTIPEKFNIETTPDELSPTSGSTVINVPERLGVTVAHPRYNPEKLSDLLLGMNSDSRTFKNRFGRSRDPKTRFFAFTGSFLSGSRMRQTMRGYTSDIPSSELSPYVIFPTDDLIFGLDAGIANNITRQIDNYSASIITDGGDPTGSNSATFNTGSMLKIRPLGAKITLFGSMIRYDKEVLPQMNQNLVSDAINEVLTSDIPCLDQYDIEDSSAFSGSYVEEYFDGSLEGGGLMGFRGIKRSLSDGNLADSGSFTRNVKLIDDRETYYDTLMPDIKRYAIQNGAEFFIESNTIKFDPFDFFLEHGSNRMDFPYRHNPIRKVRDKTRIYDSFNRSGFVSSRAVKTALFGIGFRLQHEGGPNSIPQFFNHRVTGAMGTKYGIRNTFLERTTAVFRRDRFGQFRDMLEPRRDGKMYVGGSDRPGPIECTFLDSDGERVPGAETSVSNISREATSSIPYFDFIETNRGFTTGSFSGLKVVSLTNIVSEPAKLKIKKIT